MPRKSVPKAGLDRAAVIQAAVNIVNTEGADALTINRLAQKLGIQPPSLYNHIEGLAGLWRELAVVNANSLGERITQACIGKSGPAGIRALAKAYRAHILDCPGLYRASLRASRNLETPEPRLQAAEDRVVQVAVAMVESFELEGEEAIHAVRALRSMVHGFATLEIEGGFGLPLSLEESFDRLVDIVIMGLENTKIVRS